MNLFKKIIEYIVVLVFISASALSIFISNSTPSENFNVIIHLIISGILFLSLLTLIYSRERNFRFEFTDIIFAILIISYFINLFYSKIPYVTQGYLFYYLDFFVIFIFGKHWFKKKSDLIGFILITSGAVLSVLSVSPLKFSLNHNLLDKCFIIVLISLPLALTYFFIVIVRSDLTITDQHRSFYRFLRIIIFLMIPLAIFFDKLINTTSGQYIRDSFYSKQIATDIFNENRVWGGGSGTFNQIYSPFQKHFADFQPSLNNIFYSIISEQGLVGTCLNGLLILSLLITIIAKYRKIQSQRKRIKFTGFTSALIIVTIYYFFSRHAQTIFYGFLFWGLMAIIFSLQVREPYYKSFSRLLKIILTIVSVIIFFLYSFTILSSFLATQILNRTMDKSKSESVVENEFRKLRMIDPLNYRLYINLGDYYKKNLGTDESRQSTIIAKDKEIISKMESAYQTALKLNEYAEEVYGKLSNIFNKLGDTNKADEILKKGLEKFPINVSMLSELGKSYETKGKYEEALKYYLRIKELEPKNINSYLNLARTYNKLGDKKNETDMYYKILQIDSKNKFALNALTQY